MSTPVLESSSVTPSPIALPSGLPCQEGRESPMIAEPGNWLSRVVHKAYFNSLNYCLRELGWVPQSILEVGFGDGSMLGYVAKMFHSAEVSGVEFDARIIEKAKEHVCCRVEFLELSDTDVLPFESGKFDLVVSHGFLGQSQQPRHWIGEMARVSAEALIVSAPTPRGYRWLRRIPGAGQTCFLGNPVFALRNQPIDSKTLQNWLNEVGCPVEVKTNPVPYAMMLARKPQ